MEDGAGASFLETVKNYLEKDGKSTGDELLTYEENPLYKYYYRFLTPQITKNVKIVIGQCFFNYCLEKVKM